MSGGSVINVMGVITGVKVVSLLWGLFITGDVVDSVVSLMWFCWLWMVWFCWLQCCGWCGFIAVVLLVVGGVVLLVAVLWMVWFHCCGSVCCGWCGSVGCSAVDGVVSLLWLCWLVAVPWMVWSH